jgi:histidinol-phosphate aminotransferase
MYGPAAILDALNRVRGPFNLKAPAIAAGAAAIRDRAFVEKAVEHNTLWLDKLTHAFETLGLKVTPSVTNFVLIHFPDVDGKRAPDADAFLTSRGYILRVVKGYGLPNALRMTIGSEEANRGVIETLGEFLAR